MENNLSHAGIKGMKWGRRRYQNADGSLTPEGKQRYHDDYTRVRDKKDIQSMSDKELRERINRFQMEEQYAKYAETYAATGKTRAKKVLSSVGKYTASRLKLGGNSLVDATVKTVGRKIGEGVGEGIYNEYGVKVVNKTLASIGKVVTKIAEKKAKG